MIGRFIGCTALLALAVRGSAQAISLSVDATDVTRKVLHAHLSIPAKPGPMTLLYPKWIPGEHGPTGPIVNLTGLRITAGGKPVAWRRDLEEMFALHVDVPAGATALEVDLDSLLPTDSGSFTGAASSTDKLAVISWNTVLLYPKGGSSDSLTYAAKLRLPPGWKHGTPLPVERESADGLTFKPVSLTRLVDSPVITGEYLRTFAITSGGGEPPHFLDAAADSRTALDAPADTISGVKALAAEAGALFGARHYTQYHWLLSLSDHVAHFGLEHHEASDDRLNEKGLTDSQAKPWLGMLLAHEFTHSWNGKYRRPAGLATPNYEVPMKGELLWVYEGLTEYIGTILPARSGLWTPEELRENLALTAAQMDNTVGRAWRPLQDTADAAQVLYSAPNEGSAWRRSVDYYPEGTLIWLEADTIIRQQTQGRKSLDDFCRAFHGGQSGPPAVKPYGFEEVVSTINGVAAYDWRGFFQARLTSLAPQAPKGGLERSGWKLVYSDKPNSFVTSGETYNKGVDASFTLGAGFKEDGSVVDVIPGKPAALAGLAYGMKVIAVNGRRWSGDVLHQAVKDSRGGNDPIELIVENGEYYRTLRVDYHGGERYPHLERIAGREDLLARIGKARRAAP